MSQNLDFDFNQEVHDADIFSQDPSVDPYAESEERETETDTEFDTNNPDSLLKKVISDYNDKQPPDKQITDQEKTNKPSQTQPEKTSKETTKSQVSGQFDEASLPTEIKDLLQYKEINQTYGVQQIRQLAPILDIINGNEPSSKLLETIASYIPNVAEEIAIDLVSKYAGEISQNPAIRQLVLDSEPGYKRFKHFEETGETEEKPPIDPKQEQNNKRLADLEAQSKENIERENYRFINTINENQMKWLESQLPAFSEDHSDIRDILKASILHNFNNNEKCRIALTNCHKMALNVRHMDKNDPRYANAKASAQNQINIVRNLLGQHIQKSSVAIGKIIKFQQSKKQEIDKKVATRPNIPAPNKGGTTPINRQPNKGDQQIREQALAAAKAAVANLDPRFNVESLG